MTGRDLTDRDQCWQCGARRETLCYIISMTTAQISEILRLPVGERMALLDALWDSVRPNFEGAAQIPHWHQEELERRMASGPGSQAARTWDAVEKDLRARLADNPVLYQRVQGEVRRTLTHRFPFAMYYLIEPGIVDVLAVLPTSRRPGTWQDRAGPRD